MYIKLIGVLAIEERHKRASLWAQPSVSGTTPIPATIPSPQPHTAPTDPSVVNPENQTTIINSTTIASPQSQSMMVNALQVGDIASSQCQSTTPHQRS